MVLVSRTADATMNDWQPLYPKERARSLAVLRRNAAKGTPLLRIFSRQQGYLNAEARRVLFEGRRGYVRFETVQSQVSLVACSPGEGYYVGKAGQLTVTPLTDLGIVPPVCFRLSAQNGERRLLFAGKLDEESPVTTGDMHSA